MKKLWTLVISCCLTLLKAQQSADKGRVHVLPSCDGGGGVVAERPWLHAHQHASLAGVEGSCRLPSNTTMQIREAVGQVAVVMADSDGSHGEDREVCVASAASLHNPASGHLLLSCLQERKSAEEELLGAWMSVRASLAELQRPLAPLFRIRRAAPNDTSPSVPAATLPTAVTPDSNTDHAPVREPSDQGRTTPNTPDTTAAKTTTAEQPTTPKPTKAIIKKIGTTIKPAAPTTTGTDKQAPTSAPASGKPFKLSNISSSTVLLATIMTTTATTPTYSTDTSTTLATTTTPTTTVPTTTRTTTGLSTTTPAIIPTTTTIPHTTTPDTTTPSTTVTTTTLTTRKPITTITTTITTTTPPPTSTTPPVTTADTARSGTSPHHNQDQADLHLKVGAAVGGVLVLCVLVITFRIVCRKPKKKVDETNKEEFFIGAPGNRSSLISDDSLDPHIEAVDKLGTDGGFHNADIVYSHAEVEVAESFELKDDMFTTKTSEASNDNADIPRCLR